MHIVMVTAFPADRHCIDGGVAGVAKYLVDGLSKCPNVRLSIIVPTGKIGHGKIGETIYERWDNCEVYRLGISRIGATLPTSIYDIIAGRRELKKVLRRLKPDLVHYQGCTFLASSCQFPCVLTVHGIAEYDALWTGKPPIRRLRWLVLKLTEDYGRRRVPHVILISEYVRQFLPKKNRLGEIWRIENPVADSYFDVDWQFEPGRIFCCSRVRPLKNILGMIKAFAQIVENYPHSHLRIAGSCEPAYLKTCEQETKARGVRDNVHFLGNLCVKDVQLELSKANCLAISSFQENAPLSIVEAMAAGVPVVGAKVGGIPEMVEDGRTGLLVDPYDTRDIAQAVLKILSDEVLARTMGARAREIAEERFKISVVCEKTLRAYRSVLNEKI